jgi:aminoglycoside phosphotransferase family enzyme
MDLVERELTALANIVLNRYLDLTADLDGLSALPQFMSMRAAHVSAVLNRLKPSKGLG